ncbi:ribonuclease HII [Fictibacillus sp. Mic-4]|uniref:ribonuclease HII n=1 Tax=Fictibacillus TaxID=1329200 RepID=UPI0004037F4B|nr:ribonuclease HII [Fictibacillus gelatini]
MKIETIKEIEQKLRSLAFEERETYIEKLKNDSRIGVKKLVDRFKREQLANKKMRIAYDLMLTYEKECWLTGKTLVAGIDEVGRGPLAGPVVASAVILKQDAYIPGLNDSKQLTDTKREFFYEEIMNNAAAVGVGIIPPHEIDAMNIYEATKKAMMKAVEALKMKPDHLLIDAMEVPIPIPQTKIIKGDTKSVSIAAASIIAKVTRDRLMKKLHEKYPQYGFSTNMGYGTKEHLQALTQYGITEEHRKSFAPVKQYAN